MRKIKLYKGGEKMKTLTRNRNRVDYIDNPLTEEQWAYISKELEQAQYERKMGIAEYYTLEEVMEELEQIIKEAEENNKKQYYN